MPLRKNFNKQAILNAIKNDEGFGKCAAESWRKLVDPYVPYNTGRLANDVTIRPFQISYNAPYAEEVYETNRMYRRDKHPLATSHWNEVAKPAVMDYFIQDLQNYINGKKFDV